MSILIVKGLIPAENATGQSRGVGTLVELAAKLQKYICFRLYISQYSQWKRVWVDALEFGNWRQPQRPNYESDGSKRHDLCCQT